MPDAEAPPLPQPTGVVLFGPQICQVAEYLDELLSSDCWILRERLDSLISRFGSLLPCVGRNASWLAWRGAQAVAERTAEAAEAVRPIAQHLLTWDQHAESERAALVASVCETSIVRIGEALEHQRAR